MKKNLLEWAVFAFGVAAILAVAVGLAREVAAPSGPPDLRITTERGQKVGDRWLVRVKVRNDGGEAAEAVTVRAEAGEQRAEFDLDFVPRESEREGYLVFREEPQDLKVDVSGTGTP